MVTALLLFFLMLQLLHLRSEEVLIESTGVIGRRIKKVIVTACICHCYCYFIIVVVVFSYEIMGGCIFML